MSETKPSAAMPAVPLTGTAALRADLVSGFLVFLIAMPLCLAIAKASGFDPICGIWTAVIGGLVSTWISNSQLTIKGPAAGMIVIVATAVAGMRREFCTPELFPELSARQLDVMAFQMAAGVAVVAGVIQVLFGIFRIGKLGDFFPLAAVHGLLASIGIIILAKSIPTVLGIDMKTVVGDGVTLGDLKPLSLIAALPGQIMTHATRDIGIIGLTSLVILFTLPLFKNKWMRLIPSPMVVLLVSVPMGLALGVNKSFNVNMPDVLANPSEAFFFPNFAHVASWIGIQSIILFALIGSLESLLSAKAVDLLDPQKRRTNLDRDMLGVGAGNALVAFIGGLPMISEIVRSSANINNGAQTRRANFFHACFLLFAALFLSPLIQMIPLAALSAMLIFTGFRLAHPRTFVSTYQVGRGQLVIFVTTIIVTLTTDMLLGVLSGVLVKFIMQMLHGVSLKASLRPTLEVEETAPKVARITLHEAAVFSNWLAVQKRIARYSTDSSVTVDLSDVRLIDHSVMEKFHELEQEFDRSGGKFEVVGLESHRKLSNHPQAARKKTNASPSVNGGALSMT
jgi:MFS superfamily sulfate permease-like transporter